jgi:hypothetical protein
MALLVVASVLLLWGSSGTQPLLGTPSVGVGTFGLDSPAFDSTGDGGSQSGISGEAPTDAQRDRAGQVANAYLLLYACLVVATLTGLARLVVLSRPRFDLERGDGHHPEIQAVRAATSASVQRAALAQGDPRNAIVRCWVDLEDATEQAGMDRDRSETSSEFTTRVLSLWGVNQGSIDRLAALYREARFSAHSVTPQMRDDAVAAIDEIHRQLAPHPGAGVRRGQS